MSALEGAEAEKGEPEKPKECVCTLKLGICSPFIGFNPSSTEEDPLFQVLSSKLTEKLKMAMEEFDSFPHGVIAMPPDHAPYIARKKDPYETKNQDSSPELDKKPDESDLAGFYAEDLLYGTVLAEIKKLDDSSDEKAFVMKGYKSSTFIPRLRDIANKEAKARGNDLPVELTDIEKLVNLDLKPLDDYIAKKRNGEDVRLNKQFEKFIKTHGLEPDVRSKFKFMRDHMKNGISDAEVDTLIVLPLRKLLIVIETKAATEDTNFPSKLKEGSQQCEKFHQYLKAAHWNILSEQWKLVKCVSFPLIFNLEEEKNQEKIRRPNCGCCQNCQEFIIDGRKLKNMGAWLRNVLDRFPPKHDIYHEYTNLITRILGFTMYKKNPSPWSLTLTENRKVNDYAITGSESGLSSEAPESWIWLRKGQLEALSCLRVIFSADYGTGKTLLLKKKALELSDKAANQEIGAFGQKVLFISLAALADKYKYATEAKFEEHWRNETILDLCNKLDFDDQVKKETMKVCGLSDLVEEYEKSGNRATEGLTLTELVSFILCKEEYRNHHVFIDEIPYNELGIEKIVES
ncbi:uncharacterized protein LOC111717588, partial [Eurytemora carolleeae]|uniref:uncharacterized protein LOC111717588 n=1 Tax=Eurytemora carolleeae TaxID=1294199 RepID=UPI000C77A827